VTAEKVSKHILKTSPNVNVANPTYIPPASEQSSLPKHIPPGNNGSKQDRPKPKENTAKFPQTPEAWQQADPEKYPECRIYRWYGKTFEKRKNWKYRFH
jgi:hypothetical protein